MKSDSEQEDIVKAEEQGVESSLPPVMSSSSLKLTLEELEVEAIAEEEFISDKEDEIENPLVYGDDNKLHLESQLHESEVKKNEDTLPGAIGTGDLETEGLPFNNEQALREEKMNENNDPLKKDGIQTPEQTTPDMDFGSTAEETTIETDAPVEENSALAAEMDAMLNAAGDEQPVMNMGAEVTDAPVESVASETIAPADSFEAAPVAPADPMAAPAVETPVENVAAGATIADLAANPAAAAAAAPVTAATAAPAPKKKKTGLIVGIAIAAVAVIGGGVGAVSYYNWHESAEQSVADALKYIWDAKNIQTEASIVIEDSRAEDDDDLEKMEIKMNVIATETAGAVNGGQIIATLKSGKSFTINMDSAYSLDDAIYFKVGGIKTIMDEAMADVEADEEDEASMSMITSILDGVVEVIDNQWIKIDSASLEEYGAKETYDCVKEKTKVLSSAEFKQKVADLYTNNAFLAPEGKKAVKTENDLSYYKVIVDETKYEAFEKAIQEMDEVKAISACTEDVEVEDDDEYYFDEEEEEEDEEETEYEILVGISSWEHIPKAIEIKATNADEKVATIKLNLAYEEKAVEFPGEAKTVDEVVDAIMASISELMQEMVKAQMTSYCGMAYETDAEIEACVDDAMTQYEEEYSAEMDITDFFQLSI